MVVSVVILQQGIALFRGSFGELTDAGVSSRTLDKFHYALKPLVVQPSSSTSDPPTLSIPLSPSGHNKHSTPLLSIPSLRALRSGASLMVDVTVCVEPGMTVEEASRVETSIEELLKEVRREVREVRVRFVPVDVQKVAVEEKEESGVREKEELSGR